VPADEVLTCDHVGELLLGASDGPVSLAPEARRHMARCLRCQAEAAHYRRLHRALRGLRHETVSTPSGLLDELYGALDDWAERRPGRARRRVAYVGGLAAAAGVGGAIVLASRTRRRLPLAG
jgi:hypothetical protein